MTSPPPVEESGPAWPWVVALATSGVLLSVLPHLLCLARWGDPTYVADGDGLLYLAWSRAIVRHGAWSLTDAVHRRSGPMMHPWILFLPPALLARSLGLGLGGLGIVWRVLGGLGVSLGLYAAIRPYAAGPRVAAGVAAFLLFDAGLLFGQPVVHELSKAVAVVRSAGDPGAIPLRYLDHLRVPPPALAIPFFLGALAVVTRARRRASASVGWTVGAGLALGLLYHVYFYFATAATAALALAWLVDREGRRSYLMLMGLSLAVAAPALIAGGMVRRGTPPDWLIRTDHFLPVGRFERSRLILPKLQIALWLGLTWVVLRRRRDLVFVWAVAGAGFALVNHQVVTGLEIENFHWIQAYGLALSLMVAWLGLPALARSRVVRRVGVAALAGQVALGTWLRGVEATRPAEAVGYQAMIAGWRADRLGPPAGEVVAGPPTLMGVVAAFEDVDPLHARLVEFSAIVTDEELDHRVALNLALVDVPPAEAVATIRDDRHATGASRLRRLDLLDRYRADPEAAAARFGVTGLILPSGRAPSPAVARFASPARSGTTWGLWRLAPSPGP